MYKAVNRTGLIRRLGSQCSPKEKSNPHWRDYWYIVGPTDTRACAHLGTCMSERLAKQTAREWNLREAQKRGEP